MISPKLEPHQICDVNELLLEYKDIFSDVPRLINLCGHKIELITDVPVRSKWYPLPYAMRAVVDEEFDCMLKLGVIEPGNSAYASPLIVIKKADQMNCMYVDFRNLITVFDADSMPSAEAIQSNLYACKFYSKFEVTV